MAERDGGRRAGELAVAFLFVPYGEEPPSAWLAEHPGAVRFPGRLKPRDSEGMAASAPAAQSWRWLDTASAPGPEAASGAQQSGPSASPGVEAASPQPTSRVSPPQFRSNTVTRHTIRSGTSAARALKQPPAPGVLPVPAAATAS